MFCVFSVVSAVLLCLICGWEVWEARHIRRTCTTVRRRTSTMCAGQVGFSHSTINLYMFSRLRSFTVARQERQRQGLSFLSQEILRDTCLLGLFSRMGDMASSLQFLVASSVSVIIIIIEDTTRESPVHRLTIYIFPRHLHSQLTTSLP